MKKRVILLALCAVTFAIGLFFIVPVIRLLVVAKKEGFFDEAPQQTYQGTRIGNLQAIRTALDLTYESDGQYPDAKTWMDTLFTRMKTDDMNEVTAKEKLHRPGLRPGRFGYALNSAVAGKIKKDVGDPSKAIVVYESQSTAWNAHGDPKKEGLTFDGMGLTVDGSVVYLATMKPLRVPENGATSQ